MATTASSTSTTPQSIQWQTEVELGSLTLGFFSGSYLGKGIRDFRPHFFPVTRIPTRKETFLEIFYTAIECMPKPLLNMIVEYLSYQPAFLNLVNDPPFHLRFSSMQSVRLLPQVSILLIRTPSNAQTHSEFTLPDTQKFSCVCLQEELSDSDYVPLSSVGSYFAQNEGRSNPGPIFGSLQSSNWFHVNCVFLFTQSEKEQATGKSLIDMTKSRIVRVAVFTLPPSQYPDAPKEGAQLLSYVQQHQTSLKAIWETCAESMDEACMKMDQLYQPPQK